MVVQADKEKLEQKTVSLLKHAKGLGDFNIPDQLWLIEDILPTQSLTLIYAPTGGQKSLLTLDMVRSVASGTDWLDKKSNKSKVIYVDGEMSERNIAKRVESMGISNIPRSDFSYIATSMIDEFEFDLNKKSFRQSFIKELKESDCKLLVLDNIRTLTVLSDENKSSEYTNFNNFIKVIRGMGITTIVVHHSNKSKSEDGSTSYAGSSNVATVYDQVIELQADDDKCLTLNLHKDRDSTGQSYLEQINIKYVPPAGYRVLTSEMCEQIDEKEKIRLADAALDLTLSTFPARTKDYYKALRAGGHNFKNPDESLKALYVDLIENYNSTYTSFNEYKKARNSFKADHINRLREQMEDEELSQRYNPIPLASI